MDINEPILVTGATGFIGKNLINRLLEEKRQVIAFDLPNARFPAGWQEKLKIVTGDIRDPIEVQHAVTGSQTIFHLAAIATDAGTLAQHREVTVGGTRNLMEAAAHARARVILTSSITVYGKKLQTDLLDEDLQWGDPAGFYSTAKQEQERLACEIATRTQSELVVLRAGNVYGPASPLWVDGVLRELQRGTPALINGGDFDAGLLYVENIVHALLLAASTPQAVGRAYNIADGFGITWKQYLTDLARMTGTLNPRTIPRSLAIQVSRAIETPWRMLGLAERPPLTYEAVNLVGSPVRFPLTRAETELGYKPIATYEDALVAIQNYLRNK